MAAWSATTPARPACLSRRYLGSWTSDSGARPTAAVERLWAPVSGSGFDGPAAAHVLFERSARPQHLPEHGEHRAGERHESEHEEPGGDRVAELEALRDDEQDRARPKEAHQRDGGEQ